MSATDLQKRLAERPDSVARYARSGASPSPEITGILQNISSLITDADRRHAEALRQMHTRLSNLGQEASAVRAQVPDNLASSIERIEEGLTRITSRISQDNSERYAARAASEEAAMASASEPASTTARDVSNAPLANAIADMQSAILEEEPTAYPSQPTDGAFESQHEPQWRADRVGRATGRIAAAIETAAPAEDADNPWDNTTAEALTTTYESIKADDEYMPPAPNMSSDDAPAPRAFAPATARTAALGNSQPFVAPAQPAGSSLDGIGRDWLEARFTEIATRIERSLLELHTKDEAAALDSRLEQLEIHFTQILDGVATRADLGDLKQFETHLDTLAQHVEQAQLQLQRLDTIEAQLSAVTEKLSDQRLSALLERRAPNQDDAEHFANVAAERITRELAGLATAAVQPPFDTQRLDGLHELLNAVMSEQRRGKEQTAGTLEMLQQAMIELLDRVDAIDVPPQAIATVTAVDADHLPQPMAYRHDEGDSRQPDVAAAEYQVPFETSEPEPAYPRPSLAKIADPEPVRAEQPAYVPAHPVVEAYVPAPVRPEPTYPPPQPVDEAPYQPPVADWHATPASVDAPQLEQLSTTPAPADDAASALETQQKQSKPVASTKQLPRVEPLDAVNGRARVRADMTREEMIAEARRAMQVAAAKRDAEEQAKALAKKNRANSGKITRFVLIGSVVLLLLSAGAYFLLLRTPAAEPSDIQRAPFGKQSLNSQRLLPAPDANVATADEAPAGAELRDRAEIVEINGTRLAFPGVILHHNPEMSAHDASRLRERQRLAELSARLGAAQVEAQQETGGIPVALPGGATATPRGIESDPPSISRTAPAELPPVSIGPASLRQAASTGDPSAEFEVAVRFAEGKGIQQNLQQAVRWFQRAASQGFAPAQYRLATLYERGLGIKADLARARVWYQQAAEQGHLKAMHNLAVLNAGREGVAPDYAAAARWFAAAAEHGLADSQFNLAILSEGGIGVRKDPPQAYKWFSIASRSGDREALRRLNLLRGKLSSAEIASAEQLAARFIAKPSDRLVNDAHAAGEAWKARAQADTAG